MKPLLFFTTVWVVLLASFSFSFCSADVKKNKAASATGFAVVELFTSEGCSSCPPADEAMIRLAKEFPDHVYFLGWHVDYWNYIGWKDEFSKSAYTERQHKYSELLGLNGIYTPQAIVNGKKEFVGSKENLLRNAIQSELKDSIYPGISLEAGKSSDDKITAAYKISNAGSSFLNIALVQSNASINVSRGENKGRKLDHINIVRDLKTIEVSNGAASTVDFKIPEGLSSKEVKLIAFLQDKKDWRITGATESIIH